MGANSQSRHLYNSLIRIKVGDTNMAITILTILLLIVNIILIIFTILLIVKIIIIFLIIMISLGSTVGTEAQHIVPGKRCARTT